MTKEFMSVTNVNVEELKEMIGVGGVEIIDVREVDEHEVHHVRGDKLIPMSLIPLKIDEIDWSKKVVFYCRTGARSMMIASTLSNQGRDVYHLSPGVIEWAMSEDKEFLKIN